MVICERHQTIEVCR